MSRHLAKWFSELVALEWHCSTLMDLCSKWNVIPAYGIKRGRRKMLPSVSALTA